MPVNRRCGDYAFNSCDDRMTILKNEVVPRRLGSDESIEEVEWTTSVANKGYLYLDNDGTDAKVKLNNIMYADNVQADWSVTDPEDPAYIKNKPISVLEDDFTTEVSYGSLKSGTILEKGTSAIEILLRMLKKSADVTVRFGVWYKDLPIEFEMWPEYEEVSREKLLEEGFVKDFVIQGNSEHAGVGYFWIAVPKSSQVRCESLYQGGSRIDIAEGLTEVDHGYWLIYRLDTPTTEGTFRCKFNFIDSDIGGIS